jgi:hypothetical protein
MDVVFIFLSVWLVVLVEKKGFYASGSGSGSGSGCGCGDGGGVFLGKRWEMTLW